MKAALLAGRAAALALSLSGCAGPKEPPPEVEAEALPNPEVATQRTLKAVAEAKAALYAIIAGERPVVPADLQAPLAWKWEGPLDRGAMMVARVVNFEFVAPSEGPPLPRVHINTSGMPAVDVLRAFGEQAGSAAVVDVDPVARRIAVFRP